MDFSQVRQILYGTVKRLYGSNITAIPKEPLFHYVYFRTQGIALQLFLNSLEEIYEGEYGVDELGTPLPYLSIYQELSRKVVLPAAAMAWITTSSWRWHSEARFVKTPGDLNYGMILRYPEPIARAAAYAANLHRPSLEATLLPEEITSIESAALERARRLNPSFAVGQAVPFSPPNFYML